MIKEIKIPDIAENVDTGIVAAILVSEGDEVTTEQSVVEVETDKATTDIPSPYTGKVKKITVNEGDEVKVNQVIMHIETGNEDKKEGDGTDKEQPKGDAGKDPQGQKKRDNKKERGEDIGEKGEKEQQEDTAKEDQSKVPASPLARRMASEHNVEIKNIKGTGPGQRISKSDVEDYIEKEVNKQDEEGPGKAKSELDRDGRVESMSKIREITADTMQNAWQTIPHVTQFDEADITDIENFRKNNQEKMSKKGGKLTITAILVKIAGFALQRFPAFNASIDIEKKEIIYKHDRHIGVAVDTPQGLLVPVIKDVDKKSLSEIAIELTELSQKARDKKISTGQLQGGTFTISNLGGIGGTGFTPVVYPPQVAILGVSRAQMKQIYREDKFQARLVIPMSLSYDHRLIDGADGARFLRWICNAMNNPFGLMQ